MTFPHGEGEYPVVRELSLELRPGSTLGLVGESGCGKTMTALSILGLVPHPGRVAPHSRIVFEDVELTGADPAVLRQIRGRKIGSIFQNPASSLNPVLTIGDQIGETLLAHESVGRREARARVAEMLALAGFADPAAVRDAYPHQLSGGMQQRAAIAMALVCRPALLIADEPTTALDVTIQARIIELIRDLVDELDMALLLVSHDLGVVNQVADRTVVMYSGEVVEDGGTGDMLANPAHPYTRGLLAAVVDLSGKPARGIPGKPPGPWERPVGCAFEPRCSAVIDRCSAERPRLTRGPDRTVRCWVAETDSPE